jgi:hypothetical protein
MTSLGAQPIRTPFFPARARPPMANRYGYSLTALTAKLEARSRSPFRYAVVLSRPLDPPLSGPPPPHATLATTSGPPLLSARLRLSSVGASLACVRNAPGQASLASPQRYHTNQGPVKKNHQLLNTSTTTQAGDACREARLTHSRSLRAPLPILPTARADRTGRDCSPRESNRPLSDCPTA